MAIAQQELTMAPYQVAEETFVIPWLLEAPPIGCLPMNSLLIRGQEPIIVDTGAPANREEWLRNVASVVDLEDVRWIFLSHDDCDHSGNLLQALEACPKATLLTTWFMVGRMFEEWATPLNRCRFLNDGESFDAGDRRLTAVRPPLFDNPTTRGLFDQRTGVYWAVDTFATPVPRPMTDAAELGNEEFDDGQLLGGRLISPWHAWLDEAKFQAQVRRVQVMPIKAVAGCHTPAMSGSRMERAFGLLRRMPTLDAWAEFTQARPRALVGDGLGMSITAFRHIGLSVTDLDRSLAWYSDVLGFQQLFREANPQRAAAILRLPGTQVIVGLVQSPGGEGQPFTPQRTGLDHLCFASRVATTWTPGQSG